MSTTPPHLFKRDERQQEWIEELGQIMVADPVLAGFVDRLEQSLIYSNAQPAPGPRNRRIRDWHDDNPHLLVFRSDVSGKYTLVGFQVLDWRCNGHSAFLDEAIIEVDLFAYAFVMEGSNHVVHVVTPEGSGPLRYSHVFAVRGGCYFDAANVSIADVLDRFPGQVEIVLDQIAFVADVLLGEEPVEEVRS